MSSLTLFRTSLAAFAALSLVLTWIAIDVGVPYRLGGVGEADEVAADALMRGTGISAPLVLLVAFLVLLALTWLPGRWKAIPLGLAAAAGTVGAIAGLLEIPLGSGPFAYPIGAFGIAIWFLSVVALVAVVVFGIGALVQLRRRSVRPVIRGSVTVP